MITMDVILNHMSNLCGGNAAKRDILTNWTADLLQYPQNKPGQVMALVSGPGTGTDAFAVLIARLISEEDVFTTADANEVIGPFNGKVENVRLIHLVELDWRKLSNEGIKTLISDDRITIKKMRQKPYTVASYHRLLITTGTAPHNLDHKRICIIEGAAQQSDEYFNILYAAMRDPHTIEAFRAYLMARPVAE